MKIGLTASTSKTQYYLNQAYVDYVEEAGYQPIMITPNLEAVDVAQMCDGLLLPGGIDIDPIFYGQDNLNSEGTDPEKDDFERRTYHAFVAAGKPVFGICRGFQLIVREHMRLKDTKHIHYSQHINYHNQCASLNAARTQPSHSADMLKSVLYGQGNDDMSVGFVNSMHHQALIVNFPKKAPNTMVGEMLITAVSRYGRTSKETGYIVEACDIMGAGSPIRGVQWHPEELKDVELLRHFFGEAGQEEPQQEAKNA